MNKDLAFLSGVFFEFQIPKDKRYLMRYFRKPLQAAFLRYYLVFGGWANFTDHTGMYCLPSTLKTMEDRYLRLTSAWAKGRSSFTEEGMELLDKVESGKFRLTERGGSGTIE